MVCGVSASLPGLSERSDPGSWRFFLGADRADHWGERGICGEISAHGAMGSTDGNVSISMERKSTACKCLQVVLFRMFQRKKLTENHKKEGGELTDPRKF